MLEMLTSGYSRKDLRNATHSLPMETNIGRLFSTFSYGLELVHDQSEKTRLWDDIDNAQGAVLDRYGENFGVKRNGSTDPFYRLLIKVKMISLLSGGDIDTVINATASLFDIDPALVDLDEVYPAKVWVYIDEDVLDATRLQTAELIAQVMKRIVAAGVGMRLFLRSYHRERNPIFFNTGTSSYTEVKIRPVNPQRTFTQRQYINAAAYEMVSVTIKPA
mgnify:CR=1 FL=1